MRRRTRKPKRDPSNKENEESGQEKSEGEQQKSEGENKSGKSDRGPRNRKNRPKSARNDNNRRQERDLCIKVSNITKQMRIKDLKTELRNRGCHPMVNYYSKNNIFTNNCLSIIFYSSSHGKDSMANVIYTF